MGDFLNNKKKVQEQDRRIHPRIPLKVVVTCTDAQGKENVIPKVFYAMSHNFSAGGLLVESNEKIPVSTVLEIKFSIPSIAKSTRVLGRVLRCDPGDQTSGNFLSGIIFMKIDAEDQRALYDFIAKNCE